MVMFREKRFLPPLSKRLGRFRIDWEILQRHPEFVKRCMGECIIIQARDHAFDFEGIEYVAISDWFDEIQTGEAIPYYDLFCVEGSFEDTLKFMFMRVGNDEP